MRAYGVKPKGVPGRRDSLGFYLGSQVFLTS